MKKKFGDCRVCSTVRENTFYEYNAFLSLNVSYTDDYLDISSSERIDLDVFLNKPAWSKKFLRNNNVLISDV